MKILHLDSNHELLINQLNELGHENSIDFKSPKEEIEKVIHKYDGFVIRSRFRIDKQFIDKASNLKFIARVGAGLENIDCDYAEERGITLISAPEGNMNAVGEHALGMLLSLINNLNKANFEVKNGKWLREDNRGYELEGKTVGIIGYGNMGKAFAKKLRGFDVNIICYDIKKDVGDGFVEQVSLEEFQKRVDVISLHTPQTSLTENLINTEFIKNVSNPFWLINTARGTSVVTKDLLNAIENGKILGAGLDVLEFEKSSFENLFDHNLIPESFKKLIHNHKVILSPHVAGWTYESHIKLSQTIVDKIKQL